MRVGRRWIILAKHICARYVTSRDVKLRYHAVLRQCVLNSISISAAAAISKPVSKTPSMILSLFTSYSSLCSQLYLLLARAPGLCCAQTDSSLTLKTNNASCRGVEPPSTFVHPPECSLVFKFKSPHGTIGVEMVCWGTPDTSVMCCLKRQTKSRRTGGRECNT